MENDRLSTGRNCFLAAIIAGLCLILLAATPATAGPGTNLGGIGGFLSNSITTSSPITNIPVSGPIFYPLNLSIDGPGYFVVRDPVYGQVGVTRFGGFSLDENGYIVTYLGRRVQGYVDASSSSIGDLRISSVQDTNVTLQSYLVQSNGCVVGTFSDGSSKIVCQILLQNFKNPSALIAQGWLSFGWTGAAESLFQPSPPGTSGTGLLVSGVVEKLVPKLQIRPYDGPPRSFTQGVLVSTGVPTDIGIEGNGFFLLRRTNDNALFATRAGAFYLDGSGYFVHYSGLRLQGYGDAARTIFGDIQIEPASSESTSDSGVLVSGFGIDQHGVITEYLSDGTSAVRGQILLEGCSNPDLVPHAKFDLYPLATNTGLWSALAPPDAGDLGWLVSGALETSQFDTNLLSVRNSLNFFIQGPIIATGISSDLAISGLGFFTLRDPLANTLCATRIGAFQLDTAGHLVSTNGLRVQGFTDNSDTQIGDITIAPAAANYHIDWSGEVSASLMDGTEISCGTVLVQNYRNPQGLVSAGNGFYTNVAAALPIVTNGNSSNPISVIQSGALEQIPPPPPPLELLPPPGGFRLFATDLMWGSVESSTDLVHWKILGQIEGSPDLNIGEYYDNPQASQTYYRISFPSWGPY